jgi:hypothetical protein
MLYEFQLANTRGKLVQVTNPACTEDVLTDRWPAHSVEQSTFIDDLEHLVRRLEVLPDLDLARQREILSDLFGEAPAKGAVEQFSRTIGTSVKTGQSAHVPGVGGFALAASGVKGAVSHGVTKPTPKHTFYGSS